MGQLVGDMLSGLKSASPLSGAAQIGGPMSGIGILKKLMGGGGGGDDAPNPGEKMFGLTKSMEAGGHGGNFLSKFGGNLQEMLFRQAMNGIGGGMGGY